MIRLSQWERLVDPRLGCFTVAVVFEVAAISVSLPGALARAQQRLAAVVAECDTNDWSDATRVALYRRETAWLALARHFGESIPALQRLHPTVLRARLENRLAQNAPRAS